MNSFCCNDYISAIEEFESFLADEKTSGIQAAIVLSNIATAYYGTLFVICLVTHNSS